jgi:hypothetical protein
MQDHSTTVTTTAACDLGRHSSCRKVVLSLTDAHGTPCACDCHSAGQVIAAGLPTAFAELVFTFPPCGDDLDLADLTDNDEAALEAVAEMQIEAALEAAHFGAEL